MHAFLPSRTTGWTESLFCPRRLWRSASLGFVVLLSLCLLPTQLRADDTAAKATQEEFTQLVKMAPFVVNGQSLAISIFARTKADRRYGEQFSEAVFKVVFEAVTESTGKGLVIVGEKGEPHPIFVFRKFQELAKAGKLAPEVAAHSDELTAMMNRWENSMDDDHKDKPKGGKEVDMEFDKIVTALPLPLKGVGAKLYQLAWEEKFDEAKVEKRLCELKAGDLERKDLFRHYDWAFYLPPKGAFNKVLDELISDALKQEDVGFFARVAVKGVLLAVKPKIRRAIESMRQGLMFMAMVEARTSYTEKQVSKLTGAYIQSQMPGEKDEEGSDHERAVKAVRKQLKKFESTTPAPEPETKKDVEKQ